MNVLQVNAVYGIASTGRNVKELHQELESRGINSFIACPTCTIKADNFYKIGNVFDHKMHGVLSRISGKQGYFSKHATRNFLKWIDFIQPDIVHLHNLHANYVNLIMILEYLSKRDIATVITLHDCWFFTGKCVYYSEDRCYSWKDCCGNCPCLKKGNRSWFFDRSAQMLADKRNAFQAIPRLAVVGVSKWILDESKESILKSASIKTYIYNWVDLKAFFPKTTPIRKELLGYKYHSIILAVATKWNIQKGFKDIVALSKLIDDKQLIVLIGEIESSIAIPENVIVIGKVTKVEKLAEYYSAADVFIHLSIQETFGKVIAEALACGTPAIVYDTTACPELLTTETGIVVPCGNVAMVNTAIQTIIKNGKDYYSDKCVEFVKQNFDMNTNIEKQIQLYHEVIKVVK